MFGLSALDVLALLVFLACWLGLAPFLRWRGKHSKIVAAAMVDHRRAWMGALLRRDIRIGDTAILTVITSTAGLFASTSVIVIGALLGVLFNLNLGRSAQPPVANWLAVPAPTALDIKIVLVLVVAVYAFQSFTWAIRQANFAGVVIGAAPPASGLDDATHERLSMTMGNIITGVAEAYDHGLRSYYFALAAVTWIISPALLLLASLGTVALILRRQAQSRTALALRDLAAFRAPPPGPV
ncbi:MAG TPA: DUF599 family protein [Bosea sp. (in: a-proteobacteria)]|jgi:uncharacterized membrane protein|uniref:DUF599 domain-containing protein n=1 Tax=Bosea sp. (in: a-proteobacteria) TaxID=1871050 RepID=UPI002E0E69AC|nr:DUF599 family protein [Bosea sp. (in: a-proteobacteria)]